MSEVLLINPWITDFTAYDLWSKPLGLLYLGDMLQKNGVSVELFDCMDRRSPLLNDEIKLTEWKTGKYNRVIMNKPEVYTHIPRHFARYGVPFEKVEAHLEHLSKPKIIGITGGMTYWYPGIKEMIDLCRKVFPGIPIVLGGVYATLLPSHAMEEVKPDFIARGALSEEHLKIFSTVLKKELLFYDWSDLNPLWNLYPKLDYLILRTSKGCPYGCDFCASEIVSGAYTRRNVIDVFTELKTNLQEYPVSDIAFYDDALFIDSEKFIKPFLEMIINEKLNVRFHTPNGVHSKMIDPELASLLFQANFRSLRLSFETAAPEHEKRMGEKISKDEFISAFNNLISAGFKPGQLRVYLLAGLPDQTWAQVRNDVDLVHNLGAEAALNAWSPIPGTVDYKRAIKAGNLEKNDDPLLANPSCLPHLPEGVDFDTFVSLLTEIKEKNFLLRKKAMENSK